jgi:serine protease Do
MGWPFIAGGVLCSAIFVMGSGTAEAGRPEPQAATRQAAPAPATPPVPMAPQSRPATRSLPDAADVSGAFERTARQASPSVVELYTTSYLPGQGLVPRATDLIRTERASGSGVIVDPEGYIVTNAHVVQGAQRLRVEIPIPAAGQSILAMRSRSVSGEVVGIDLETDLAVIKVTARDLPALPLGDSDELSAGQLVLAFGSPLGLHNTVSLGIVGAVARQLEPDSPMIYVQTDASINAGSSGGPLVDLRGQVVGINTLILSRTGAYEGVGFAAPSNIVRTVYEHIRRHGRVRRGDIGVRAQTVTPELAAGLKLPRDSGVVLADVLPGSPAARSGLRVGDLVVALDGKPMENGRQLQVGLYRRFVGDIVSLDILREGQPLTFPVAMIERSDPLAAISPTGDPREHLVPRLGILGVELTPRIAAMMQQLRTDRGVVVASMVANAIEARRGGLAVGDVIRAINTTPVDGLAMLRRALDALPAGAPVVLQLERQGELMYLAFSVE